MNISEFTLILLFLFLPGIIGVLLIGMLTNIRIADTKIFFLYAYLLSIISYTISGFFKNHLFLNFLIKGEPDIKPKEILITTVIGILLTILIIYCINSKMLYKLAGKISLSTKFGNNDVWLTLFNETDTVWITLRPSNCEEYFVGEVQHFSDDPGLRELLLLNVAIYEKETGKYMYSQEKIYFSFQSDNEVTIEVGSHYQDELRKGAKDGETNNNAKIH